MPSSAARTTKFRTAARFSPAALRAASCRAAAFFAAAAAGRRGRLAGGLAGIRRSDGCVQELFEGIEQALSEHVEVADGVPVGRETEEDLARRRR